ANAAIDTLRRWRSPSSLLGGSVQNGEMLRMIGHQLATELERIFARGMRELVHEALEIDRVLIVVHAAPETRRHVRVPHRVIDEQIGDGIAELAERTIRIGVEPLEMERVHAVLHATRSHRCQDRLAGDAEMQSNEIPILSEGADELRLRDRPELAMQHVLLA